MNIAIFTDTYLPTMDGIVTTIVNTQKCLKDKGHQIHLFCPDAGKPENEREDITYLKSISYHRYPSYRLAVFPDNQEEILKEFSPDIVHSHGLAFMGLKAIRAAKYTKVPLVLTYHTLLSEAMSFYNPLPIPKGISNKLLEVYVEWFLSRGNIITVGTEAIKRKLILDSNVFENAVVVPSGVDINRFNPTVSGVDIRKHYNLEDSEVIVHLSRIGREKNISLILRAMKHVIKSRPCAKLLIGGEGPAKTYYMNLAKNLGVNENTLFAGFVSPDDLPLFYAAGDVFVIASKFETQGLTTIEAMASGVPVAGINHGAIPEVVDHGVNGYLFSENPKDCAMKIISALEEKDSLSKNARKTAEKYSMELCTERLLDVYKHAIDDYKKF